MTKQERQEIIKALDLIFIYLCEGKLSKAKEELIGVKKNLSEETDLINAAERDTNLS